MSTKPQDTSSSDTSSARETSESSKASTRTWAFVAAAIGCLLITGIIEWMNRPEEISEYGKVGDLFYPDFEDESTATSLSVSVIDPEEVKPLEFSVKQAENGQWVIPSHHNYPADAADQLAKTASSVIGIKRGAMVTRWPADHARYGVVDPQTDSVGIDELEGLGKRITIGGKDDEVLASFIVGNKVDGPGNQYYVRHPDEDETYIADLDINLTTRFADWVNTDLLEINAADVRLIDLKDYSFDEIQGTVTGSVESEVKRASATDDWVLAGIDDATQEVNAESIQATLDALASVEIAGVRPKQPGLTADLRLDRDALQSQRDADRLTRDLLARGFLLQQNASDQSLALIAREGEMFVGLDDGLLYRLYFGRVFTGSEEELEIGLSKDSSESEEGDSAEEGSDEKVEIEIDETKESGKPGRYVFVRVNFDPSLFAEQLTSPVEPTESEELKALREKVSQAATEEGGAEKTEDEAAGEEAEDAEPAETDARKLQRLETEFVASKLRYEDDVAAYKAYEQRLKDGQAKADELNRRFALWYYVIPGESYDKLAVKASDLIKDKDTPEAAMIQESDNAPPTIGELSNSIMKAGGSLDAPANAADEATTDDGEPQEDAPETAQPPAAADAPEGDDKPEATEDSPSGGAEKEDPAKDAGKEGDGESAKEGDASDKEESADDTGEEKADDADSSADSEPESPEPESPGADEPESEAADDGEADTNE